MESLTKAQNEEIRTGFYKNNYQELKLDYYKNNWL